jgi:hypothetical protein
LDTQRGTLPMNIFLLPHHHLPNHWNQHAPCAEYQIKNEHIRNYFSVPDPIDIIQKRQFNLLGKFAHMDPTCLPHKFLTTWLASHPWCSGGQHYTLRNSYVETLQHILPNIPDNGTIDLWLPLVQSHEHWKTLGTEWIKHWQALPHDLSVWSSSSFGRWHPRSSVLLVLTRHSLPILNEQWTRVINLSMFFLLCYDLTTTSWSWALHQVLSLAIQYAWCS